MNSAHPVVPQALVEMSPEIKNIETLIKTHIKKLIDLKIAYREAREMLTEKLESIPEYRTLKDDARGAMKEERLKKETIMETPQCQELSAKLDDLKEQRMELQDGLSTYLSEYRRLTNADQIKISDDLIYRIESKFKVVPVQLKLFPDKNKK